MRGIPSSILWKSVYPLAFLSLTFQPDSPLLSVTSDGLLNDLPECQWERGGLQSAAVQHVTLMRAVYIVRPREKGDLDFNGRRRGADPSTPQIADLVV